MAFNEQASIDYEHLTVADRALHGELRDQYRALQQFKINATIERGTRQPSKMW